LVVRSQGNCQGRFARRFRPGDGYFKH
jgi:hypothetical protein